MKSSMIGVSMDEVSSMFVMMPVDPRLEVRIVNLGSM